MIEQARSVLVLAPHTDDGEFGCGATMARLIGDGVQVRYVAFSISEESVSDGLPRDILATEVSKATSVLGIGPEDLVVERFPVRHFPSHRQEILERMVALNNEYDPDLVFIPSPNDTHQDHQVVAQEGFRAFKKTSLLGYEVPWNNLTFNTNAFCVVSEDHMRTKLKALKCYYSQLGRHYVNDEFILSWARTRGGQIGEAFAESFEVIRWRL